MIFDCTNTYEVTQWQQKGFTIVRLGENKDWYQLQQAFGGRDKVSKEFAQRLQEYSLTNQKEFTDLIISTYLDLNLIIPSIVSKTSKGFAFSQMFLLGLLGDKPRGKL